MIHKCDTITENTKLYCRWLLFGSNKLIVRKEIHNAHVQRELVDWTIKYHDNEVINAMRKNKGYECFTDLDQFIDNAYYFHFY